MNNTMCQFKDSTSASMSSTVVQISNATVCLPSMSSSSLTALLLLWFEVSFKFQVFSEMSSSKFCLSHGCGTIASVSHVGPRSCPTRACLQCSGALCAFSRYFSQMLKLVHTHPSTSFNQIPTGVCNHKRYLSIAIPQHEASRLRHPDRLCAKYLAQAFQLHLSPLIFFSALCFFSSWPSCICAFEYCPSEGGLFM